MRPRRELLEAIFAYAVYLSGRRRAAARIKPQPINTVADRGQIWFKANQVKVLERYAEHVAYLERNDHMSPRTLTRHVAAARRGRFLAVGNYSRFDRRRGEWVQEPNVYTITRELCLWIKRHARGLRIPRFL